MYIHITSSQKHNLKCRNVVLPVTGNSFYGFSATLRKGKDLIPTENSSCPPSSSTRSTSSNIKTKSSSGVLEKSCIICLKKHKKCNQKKQPLIKASTEEILKSIKNYAQRLQDWEILKQIQYMDFAAKKVHYYNICQVR